MHQSPRRLGKNGANQGSLPAKYFRGISNQSIFTNAMICLARSIKSIKPAFHFITRRPLPINLKCLPPIIRLKHYAVKGLDKDGKTSPVRERPAKRLNRTARKKAVRTERRAQEKEEAKIPGSPAHLKLQLKTQKLERKQARRARIAAGESLENEADIKAEEQGKLDREKLAKKRAEPVRRQDRRDFKRKRREDLEKSPEELLEEKSRGFQIRKQGVKENRPDHLPDYMTGPSRWDSIRSSPSYTPRVYKTKEEYALERASRGKESSVGRKVSPTNDLSSNYKSRDHGNWGTSWSPMDSDGVRSVEEGSHEQTKVRQDLKGSYSQRPGLSQRRSDRTEDHSRSNTRMEEALDRKTGQTEKRPWQGRSNENTSQKYTAFDRKNDRTESPRRSDDRGDRSATPFASRSRRDEPYEKPKREQWMVQKDAIQRKFGDEAWAPKKRLSPDTLEAIRTMHKSDPDKFSTPLLAEQFKVSAEVIRRILRTKWQPDEEEVLDRQERWARRGERIWTKQAELGVRPPKKWREMGVANTGEAGVAPKYKKNAHTRDKYGEQPKHFVAQRRGASSGSVDFGYKKPFSDRIL